MEFIKYYNRKYVTKIQLYLVLVYTSLGEGVDFRRY